MASWGACCSLLRSFHLFSGRFLWVMLLSETASASWTVLMLALVEQELARRKMMGCARIGTFLGSASWFTGTAYDPRLARRATRFLRPAATVTCGFGFSRVSVCFSSDHILEVCFQRGVGGFGSCLEFGNLGSGDTQGTESMFLEATRWQPVEDCGFGLSFLFFLFRFSFFPFSRSGVFLWILT